MSTTLPVAKTHPATLDLAFALAGVAGTALLAQVQVPWEPVPFTLQTLGVALTGLALGARRGALSQSLYVVGGACGLPLFAGFRGGPAHLFGPTGGYLVAFVLMAWFIGSLKDRGATRSAVRFGFGLASAFLGTLLVGAAWLSLYVGVERAWMLGVVPFLIPEALKAVAALGLRSLGRDLSR